MADILIEYILTICERERKKENKQNRLHSLNRRRDMCRLYRFINVLHTNKVMKIFMSWYAIKKKNQQQQATSPFSLLNRQR